MRLDGDDFNLLMGLVDDGPYLSMDDVKGFIDLYEDYKGMDFDLIAFSYKQGDNVEANKALAAKMAMGEGQLVDLSDNGGAPEGIQFEDEFLTNKEGKQQNVDVAKLSDITDPCLMANNYAILGDHHYIDGGAVIAAVQG